MPTFWIIPILHYTAQSMKDRDRLASLGPSAHHRPTPAVIPHVPTFILLPTLLGGYYKYTIFIMILHVLSHKVFLAGLDV